MNSRTWIAAALALALVGCAKQTTAPMVVAPPAGPAATSPTGVVARLAWALQARDHVAYARLFTDDYRFQFAANDSSGNRFPAHSMDRPQETTAIQNMFAGTGSLPPVSDLQIVISNLLVPQPDPRVGMNSSRRRSVRTPMALQITFDEGGSPMLTSINGYGLFFVVRGDSAFFLPARAAERDSTRWFISRWEDETAGASGVAGMHTLPTRSSSLGSVKALYVPAAVSAR